MTLRKLLAVSCLLFPLMASAHNFVDGQRVARHVRRREREGEIAAARLHLRFALERERAPIDRGRVDEHRQRRRGRGHRRVDARHAIDRGEEQPERRRQPARLLRAAVALTREEQLAAGAPFAPRVRLEARAPHAEGALVGVDLGRDRPADAAGIEPARSVLWQ